LLVIVAAELVVTVKKSEGFCAQTFSNSGGNHQEKVAEGILCRFPRLWQFPQASPSAAFFLFCLFFLSL